MAILIFVFGFSACSTKVSFKLNFVIDNATYATIDTSGDEIITLPDNPTKENYTFDGWYWDKDTWQQPFTANSLLDAPLSSNMSVYAKFTLNTINGVSFEDVETTYDGTQKTISICNLPDGATVSYDKSNTYVEAGIYTITATVKQDNYEVLSLTATLTINKATYDMSGVVFANKTVTYNGESHSITASNLPKGVSVTYENNGKVTVGTYTIIAKFTGDSKNYEAIPDKTATLKIEKVNVEKPLQDNTSFVYNGKEQTYTVVKNSYYNINGNKQTDAGNYTVIISLKDKNNYQWKDKTTKDITYSFKINKATYDMSGVKFENKTVTYNGESHSITASNLPNGVSVTYENNGKVTVGTYTITAKFTGDSKNYEAIPDKTATLNILNSTFKGLSFESKSFIYDGLEKKIEVTGAPSDVTVTYNKPNKHVNAGTYTITATIKKENYTDVTLTATLTINKATYDMSGVVFADKTVTYNGNAHSILAQNLPNGLSVSYNGNGKINADTYTVTAIFTDTTGNYEKPENKTAKLTINKATVSGITFEDKTYTYNGNSHALAITGKLPNGVSVTYANNDKINVGTYTVTATFTCDTENYVVLDDMTATLTIKKAVYDMSGVSFNNQAVTYDGKTHALYISGNLPNGVTVSYANNNQTNANQYIVVASFTGDAINYYAIDDMQAMLTINKATYDMSNVSFVGGRFTYDGTSKSIYISGNLPDGVSVTYTNNGKINANTYTVTAKFAGDTENYNLISDWTASLIIDKATYDMSGVVFKNQTFTYDTTAKNALITGTLPNGVEVSYVGNGKTDVGTYTVTAKFSGDRNNYRLINDITATLKINKAVPYIKDATCNQTLNTHSTVILVANTEVKGTIKLDDGQTLSIGYKTYGWTFTPEDTHNYTDTTGTVGLTVCALVSYYNDSTLFSSQNIVLNNSAYVPGNIPTKNDKNGLRYTFSHWSIEENGAEYNFVNAVTSDLALHAVYDSEEIVYAINYYDTKGVENTNIKTYTVSTAHTLSNLEKEHYVFNGWADSNGNTVTKINKGTFGVLNLYAKWTPIEYKITYELKSGTNNNKNPTSYTVEDEIILYPAQKSEYAFIYWTIDDVIIEKIEAGSIWGDIHLVANYCDASNLDLTLNSDGTLTLKKVNKDATSVIIYEKYDGHTVISIGDSAFEDCSSLTSITIPDGVTNIGDYAFFDCSSLTTIAIPNSVTSIGYCAFEDCSSLTSITIPDGVTSIGSSAFYDCEGLTSITIPDGVTNIGSSAFRGCKGLTSITIPNSVTSIGDSAFA